MRRSRIAYKPPHFADKHKKRRITAAVIILCIVGIFGVSAAVHTEDNGTYLKIKEVKNGKYDLEAVSETSINVLNGEKIEKIPLEEYIAHVVSAEMPVSYDEEALKAQAIAARTYTLRKAERGGCSRSEEADICTDSGHCQAYADDEKLKARWKDDYEENINKIMMVTADTAGEILVYEGEMIEALFCASAGGMTENSENVYSEARDYLKSVESPDTEGYIFEKTFSQSELTSLLNKKLGTEIEKEALTDSLEVLSRYESGRVKSFRIGDETFSGKKIRSALGLSSANFDFLFDKDDVVFTSVGHGHGIGMSQSGANVLAKEGMSCEEILLYYYQGVSIEKM